jgi:hypothetical protein
VVAPYTAGDPLFGAELTGPVLARGYTAGTRVAVRPGTDPPPDAGRVLFLIRADGLLVPVTAGSTPAAQDGDRRVLLDPHPPGAAPAARWA